MNTYFDKLFSISQFCVSDFRGEKWRVHFLEMWTPSSRQEWQFNIVGITGLWLKNSDPENPVTRCSSGVSLVAQWLRNRLPMQGTRVRALVREDLTCHRATKSMSHNYWACALEPVSHNYWALVPQLLKPACLEPVLPHKRSHHNEKPMHHKEE